MIKCVLLSLLLLLLAFTASAQDNNFHTYSLRQPTVEEYFQQMPWTYLRRGLGDEYRYIDPILRAEAAYRYPDYFSTDMPSLPLVAVMYNGNGDLELLYNDYLWMLQEDGLHGESRFWMEQIVMLWLEQNAVNLDDITTLELKFERFILSVLRISVTAVDFDGDGQNEWMLQFQDGNNNIAFLKRTAQGYEAIATTLPWAITSDLYFFVDRGTYDVPSLEDVTGDGRPEIIGIYGCMRRARDHEHGYVYIVGWEGSQLKTLLTLPFDVRTTSECAPPVSPEVSWEFLNVDTDAAQEIIFIQRDASECPHETLYDWDGETYVADESSQEISEACETIPTQVPATVTTSESVNYMQEAVDAFNAGDYTEALTQIDAQLLHYPNPEASISAHYFCGVILEALDRPEEAVVEYLLVLEAGLQSIDLEAMSIDYATLPNVFEWYRLASLHLEIDPPIELPLIS